MQLSQTDIALFYKLWYELNWSINQKYAIVPEFDKPIYGQNVDQQLFHAIRNELWKNPHWIDEFLNNSKFANLNDEERAIISIWRKEYIKGRFLIMQHMSKYSVFMGPDKDNNLYGVCGISDSLSEKFPSSILPLMVDTVLIPFKDKIIYDGLLNTFNISFGRSMRGGFKESYRSAKKEQGIIEQIGVLPVVVTKNKKREAEPVEKVDPRSTSIPKAMISRYEEIAKIIEVYCDLKLNEEYKEVCLKVLLKLARKRPSPLISGRVSTWACGIVYTVGVYNDAFDKSSNIRLVENEVVNWFGVEKRTASNQMGKIDELLGLSFSRMDITVKC